MLGCRVESDVGARVLNASLEGKFRLWYLREGNNEVDFILQRDDEVTGLEIKTCIKKPAGGKQAFEKRFQPKTRLIFSECGFPVEEFLMLDPDRLF
jgi:predicted AAA+ superfamily ATPase